MELVGYARVSTTGQHLDLQIDALRTAGCLKVFTDQVSGRRADRPGLEALREYVRGGDTVVVWKLDRLGRSTRHLVHLMGEFETAGIAVRSLTEGIDTNTAHGRLVFTVIGAIAELERELIIERTRAGQAAARQRGRHPGRPRTITLQKQAAARDLHAQGRSLGQIARIMDISKTSVHRIIHPAELDDR